MRENGDRSAALGGDVRPDTRMYRDPKPRITLGESALPMLLTFRNNSRRLASGQVTRYANYPRSGRHLNWINSPHFFSGPVEGQLMMNATEWNGIG